MSIVSYVSIEGVAIPHSNEHSRQEVCGMGDGRLLAAHHFQPLLLLQFQLFDLLNCHLNGLHKELMTYTYVYRGMLCYYKY